MNTGEISASGVLEGNGRVSVSVYCDEDMDMVEALQKLYTCHIYVEEDVALKNDLTVNEEDRLWLYGYESGNVTLTVPVGVTLTNNGTIHMGECIVIYEENSGWIETYVSGTLDIQGNFVNNGVIEVDENAVLVGSLDGVGKIYSFMAGDTDGDGRIETEDLIKLMKYTAGVEMGDFGTVAADVTGDGVTDILDVIRLVRYLSGEDVVLC